MLQVASPFLWVGAKAVGHGTSVRDNEKGLVPWDNGLEVPYTLRSL